MRSSSSSRRWWPPQRGWPPRRPSPGPRRSAAGMNPQAAAAAAAMAQQAAAPPLKRARPDFGASATMKSGDVTELQIGVKGTLTDGTVFDSSYDRGDPFEFTLGNGQVIKGWDQGLLGMCVGEKRKLKIAKMGYGERGSPPKIPGHLVVQRQKATASFNTLKSFCSTSINYLDLSG